MKPGNNPVRILQITDPHLFADAAGSLRGRVTAECLDDVLAHANDSGWSADLVAVTGDLIQDDSPAAYQRFRRQFEKLGIPVHCVPGNHDVRALMKQIIDHPPFYYCAAVELRSWFIIGIDSCKEGSAGGRIAAEELHRLADLLRRSRQRHVMICLHHPPVRIGSRWLDEVGLENADEFLALVSAFENVRLVVFGHVHQPSDSMYQSLRILGTPSTCRQFRPGSDYFAVDEHPPAYRRLQLGADGSIHTELIWVPQPSAKTAAL